MIKITKTYNFFTFLKRVWESNPLSPAYETGGDYPFHSPAIFPYYTEISVFSVLCGDGGSRTPVLTAMP